MLLNVANTSDGILLHSLSKLRKHMSHRIIESHGVWQQLQISSAATEPADTSFILLEAEGLPLR